MVFSSLFFLFYFLPVVIGGYFFIPQRLRNIYLLLASLFFYAWGEGVYVLLMLFCVLINYCAGLLLSNTRNKFRKTTLGLAVAANLLPLLYYKYSQFLLENISGLFETFSSPSPADNIHLPLGISFFTFQAISYLIDIYRKTSPAQTNPINLGLFIALFPQLIAGPIVRYHDIAAQIEKRSIDLQLFAGGTRRFIIGLGKKVLIANPLGLIADTVFNLPTEQLNTTAAWIGVVSYTLQIYYDFSGYSDMAIGLGRIFGFTFLENFNYPYISRSIQEFWRRWHISLSNWFRDYLYIPLGGNRLGSWRTTFNLFVVFLLCGVWHGASWTFIVWGLYHGFFLALERGRFGKLLVQLPDVLRHLYALLLVMVGWVFFRSETIEQGREIVKALFGNADSTSIPTLLFLRLDPLFYTTLCIGILGALPLTRLFDRYTPKDQGREYAKVLFLTVVLYLSIASLATGVYNPFIYFRF